MSSRFAHLRLFLGMALGIASLCVAAIDTPRPIVVWNATASAPIGFYRVTPLEASSLRNGELILIRLPAEQSRLYAERGYLPADVPLLKRIAATGGQKVCERGGILSIDGRRVAAAMSVDGKGRRLAAWSECRRLRAYEVFALMPDVPASLDGRYFGPTSISSIVGRAQPLWIPGVR